MQIDIINTPSSHMCYWCYQGHPGDFLMSHAFMGLVKMVIQGYTSKESRVSDVKFYISGLM